MSQTITLVLNATSQRRHEHAIDTFVVHVTPELANQLLALCAATRDLGRTSEIAPHIAARQVAALVLSESPDAPGLFATPTHKTRQARRTHRLSDGVWAVPHDPSTARPAGVSNRHLMITPSSVWWNARASIKADEVMTAPVTVETLEQIARGSLHPQTPPAGKP